MTPTPDTETGTAPARGNRTVNQGSGARRRPESACGDFGGTQTLPRPKEGSPWQGFASPRRFPSPGDSGWGAR